MATTIRVQVPGGEFHRVRVNNHGAVSCLDHPATQVKREAMLMEFGNEGSCPCLKVYARLLLYVQRLGQYGPHSPTFWRLSPDDSDESMQQAQDIRLCCWPPRPAARRAYRKWVGRFRIYKPGRVEVGPEESVPRMLADTLRKLGHAARVEEVKAGLTPTVQVVWRDCGQNDKAVKLAVMAFGSTSRVRDLHITFDHNNKHYELRTTLSRVKKAMPQSLIGVATAVEELIWTAIHCSQALPFFANDNEKEPAEHAACKVS